MREFERINGVLPAGIYANAHAVAFRDSLLKEGELSAATIVRKMNLLAGIFSTAAKNGSDRLFPNVSSGGVRQLTASFSQWWGRYARRDVGTTDTKKHFIRSGTHSKTRSETATFRPTSRSASQATLASAGTLRSMARATHSLRL